MRSCSRPLANGKARVLTTSTPSKTFADYGIDLGSKSGIEVKVTCSQCSAGRKKKNYPCLSVNTDKDLWNCWHCGRSGTLKGGEWQRPEIRKVYRRPEYTPAEQVPDGTIAWFATRRIGPDVVRRIDGMLTSSPTVREYRRDELATRLPSKCEATGAAEARRSWK
ncbi:hypothetical protein [Trinickia sp.]|uniref:hypothetical protein n=1 Tax=Trinickia sp. TaxID=2571163 RepID=UPI003F81D3AF